VILALVLERALAAGVDDCGVRCCENLFEAFAFLDGVARACTDLFACGHQFLRLSDQSARV
jgi:hypothetical protein